MSDKNQPVRKTETNAKDHDPQQQANLQKGKNNVQKPSNVPPPMADNQPRGKHSGGSDNNNKDKDEN